MNKFIKYVGLLALGFVGLSSCQDDFDAPSQNVPVATIAPNTSIAEVKAKFWSDDRNYIMPIDLKENGEHYIISGRVISSDATGNVYKSLIIRDETAALAMSINANSLYNTYQVGQEIVVDLTGMYIGKYNGLQQLGYPQYSQAFGWEATFMSYEFFKGHIQLNGLPEPEKVEPILLTGADLQSGTVENLQRLQSQYVRFNDVYFKEGGTATFTNAPKENQNRDLVLADGTALVVRTSGYASFCSNTLPAGHGDIIGILSYYGTDWQFTLLSDKDCINFGNPTMNPGNKEMPYTVDQAIAVINRGTAANDVWTTGYIVGAVAPGVTEITSADNIEFGANVSLDKTLVIAATPDETDYTKCLAFELPQGSPLRRYGNLLDNPSNLGKEIVIMGNLGKYLGMPGITGNTGAADSFTIVGVEIPEDVTGTIFSESFESTQGAFTVQDVKKPAEISEIWKQSSSYKCMVATAYESASKVNYESDSWLISPEISLKGAEAAFLSFDQAMNYFSSLDVAKTQTTVAVREAGSAAWTTLTIPSYPSSLSFTFVNTGDIDLSAYVGKTIQIGFHYTSTASKAGTWEVKNVLISTEGTAQGGGGDDPTPPTGDGTTIGADALANFNLPGVTTASGYTFDIQKGSGSTAPAFNAASNALRLYADNTMKVTGKNITRIVVTLNSSVKYRYTTFTPNVGAIVPAQATGDTQIVWQGNSNDVTFTVGHDAVFGSDGAGARGQIHISSITIYSE